MILEFVFSVGKALLSAGARAYFGRAAKEPVPLSAARFSAIHQLHGMSESQVAAALGLDVAIGDLGPSRVANVLRPEWLDATARLYRIRRAWFDAAEEHAYEFDQHYKREMPELVDWLKAERFADPSVELYCFRTNRTLGRGDAPGEVFLALRRRAAILYEFDIPSYSPLGVFPWDHPSAHLHALRVIAAATALGLHVRGYFVSQRTFERVAYADDLVGTLFQNSGKHWHPEDYVLTRNQSWKGQGAELARQIQLELHRVGLSAHLRPPT